MSDKKTFYITTPVSYTHLDVYKRQTYDQLADQYPHRIQRIDASGSPQDVFALVQTAIGTLFKDRGRIYHG